MNYTVLLAYNGKPSVGVDTPIVVLQYEGIESSLTFDDKIVEVTRANLIKSLNGIQHHVEREFVGECLVNMTGNSIWIVAS